MQTCDITLHCEGLHCEGLQYLFFLAVDHLSFGINLLCNFKQMYVAARTLLYSMATMKASYSRNCKLSGSLVISGELCRLDHVQHRVQGIAKETIYSAKAKQPISMTAKFLSIRKAWVAAGLTL